MWSVLIAGFLSGALVANGVPYFVRGTAGKKHTTPLGKPASASQSFIWGWLNFAVAAIIWHFAEMRIHPRAAFVAVALGVLVGGLNSANSWTKSSKA